MSTRSVITKKEPNGKFRAIFCHSDGYLAGGVGETLVRFYTDSETVDKLLDLGDMSSLGEKPIGYLTNFEVDRTGCVTYKERGETNVDAREFDSIEQILEYYSDCDYFYFFIDEDWKYCDYNYEPGDELKSVAKTLRDRGAL